MYRIIFSMAVCFFFACSGVAADLFHDDFASGLNSWKCTQGKEAVKIVADNNRPVLEINDDRHQMMVEMSSAPVAVGTGVYAVSGRIKVFKNDSPFLIMTDFFDVRNRKLGQACLGMMSDLDKLNRWQPFILHAAAPWQETASLRVRLVSLHHSLNHLWVDGVTVAAEPVVAVPPPWTPKYKIKPDQRERLTAADVVGPDGVVYPDWTRAGVQQEQSGLTDRRVVKIEDFGGKADDDRDDSGALSAAVNSLRDSGGIVQLGAGRYRLEHMVALTVPNVMIRGMGMAQTFIAFEYRFPDSGIDFAGLTAGQKIGPKTDLHVYCRPEQLEKVRVSVNGEQLLAKNRAGNSGQFALVFNCRKAKQLQPGALQLKVEAFYHGGVTQTATLNLVYDPNESSTGSGPEPRAVITFSGSGPAGSRLLLAEDGKRGDTVLTLKKTSGLKAGDWIVINAPETDRRRKETNNACRWGEFRNYIVRISRVDGPKVALEQPLRLDFPVIDGAWISRVNLLSGCGIADLTLESKSKMALSTVLFDYAVNCRAEKVKVVKCGRHPIYAENAKFCTIAECEFDDAWFKGRGGTGYAGWDKAYDCLMDKVVTRKLRHAPCLQWSASGNVIRRCRFLNTDAHWHAGWTSENLIEQCYIDARDYAAQNQGYGYGMWASPPQDGNHGPEGPRNVVYNCDVIAEKSGVFLGGMNESWLILYNRFNCLSGPGMILKDMAFDSIIRGNVFILNQAEPAIRFFTPDCSGTEVIDNLIVGGNGKLWDGLSRPAFEQGNRFLPRGAVVPAASSAVPSIYEWQLRHGRK